MTRGITDLDGNWIGMLKDGITGAGGLAAGRLVVDAPAVETVRSVYPMFINAYYAGLITAPDDAIGRQVIPDIRELQDQGLTDDPLAEERQSPVPGIIHRYPDRVIFLVSNRCPVLCRFCMRKRLAGRATAPPPAQMAKAFDYLRAQTAVREVILSGGDPLLLDDGRLDDILTRIRRLPHIQTIRIHSRVPCALPQRVTSDLADMLKKHHPLYLNIHINHPDEVTEAVVRSCNRLADAGIPLGSQTVLLKGVNDAADVMALLMRRLLSIRVKPYYLHHPDLVKGTAHFRVSVETGLAIMRSLQGYLSGSAIPRYMIDLPGGGGKIPLSPVYIQGMSDNMMIVRNYRGETFSYPADA
jgi:lysine 2,3-aminomutase